VQHIASAPVRPQDALQIERLRTARTVPSGSLRGRTWDQEHLVPASPLWLPDHLLGPRTASAVSNVREADEIDAQPAKRIDRFLAGTSSPVPMTDHPGRTESAAFRSANFIPARRAYHRDKAHDDATRPAPSPPPSFALISHPAVPASKRNPAISHRSCVGHAGSRQLVSCAGPVRSSLSVEWGRISTPASHQVIGHERPSRHRPAFSNPTRIDRDELIEPPLARDSLAHSSETPQLNRVGGPPQSMPRLDVPQGT